MTDNQPANQNSDWLDEVLVQLAKEIRHETLALGNNDVNYPVKPVFSIAKQAIQAKLDQAVMAGRIDEAKRAANHNDSEYTSDYLELRITELNQPNRPSG